MRITNRPTLWRTADGQRSRSGDDYCVLHGDFRCPECEQAERGLHEIEATESDTWEPISESQP